MQIFLFIMLCALCIHVHAMDNKRNFDSMSGPENQNITNSLPLNTQLMPFVSVSNLLNPKNIDSQNPTTAPYTFIHETLPQINILNIPSKQNEGTFDQQKLHFSKPSFIPAIIQENFTPESEIVRPSNDYYFYLINSQYNNKNIVNFDIFKYEVKRDDGYSHIQGLENLPGWHISRKEIPIDCSTTLLKLCVLKIKRTSSDFTFLSQKFLEEISLNGRDFYYEYHPDTSIETVNAWIKKINNFYGNLIPKSMKIIHKYWKKHPLWKNITENKEYIFKKFHNSYDKYWSIEVKPINFLDQQNKKICRIACRVRNTSKHAIPDPEFINQYGVDGYFYFFVEPNTKAIKYINYFMDHYENSLKNVDENYLLGETGDIFEDVFEGVENFSFPLLEWIFDPHHEKMAIDEKIC